MVRAGIKEKQISLCQELVTSASSLGGYLFDLGDLCFFSLYCAVFPQSRIRVLTNGAHSWCTSSNFLWRCSECSGFRWMEKMLTGGLCFVQHSSPMPRLSTGLLWALDEVHLRRQHCDHLVPLVVAGNQWMRKSLGLQAFCTNKTHCCLEFEDGPVSFPDCVPWRI
jgi:hypothetical protein